MSKQNLEFPRGKRMTTQNGNYLVCLVYHITKSKTATLFFFMNPTGKHIVTKGEQRKKELASAKTWEWAKTAWKNSPVFLTEEELKLARAAWKQVQNKTEKGILFEIPKKSTSPRSTERREKQKNRVRVMVG